MRKSGRFLQLVRAVVAGDNPRAFEGQILREDLAEEAEERRDGILNGVLRTESDGEVEDEASAEHLCYGAGQQLPGQWVGMGPRRTPVMGLTILAAGSGECGERTLEGLRVGTWVV